MNEWCNVYINIDKVYFYKSVSNWTKGLFWCQRLWTPVGTDFVSFCGPLSLLSAD